MKFKIHKKKFYKNIDSLKMWLEAQLEKSMNINVKSTLIKETIICIFYCFLSYFYVNYIEF